MAIRIRKINNKTVALCAANSEKKEGDIYLDDNAHHALYVKFDLDFFSEDRGNIPLNYEEIILMAKEMNGKIW